MLFFGLIGELGYLSTYVSTTLGFIPFVLNFKHIKETFLPSSEDKFKNALFYWFVFFWGLYGVFAVMSYTIKNTGYNILDIFSKNFFGVFLAYVVWSKSK
jgi:dipeptidase